MYLSFGVCIIHKFISLLQYLFKLKNISIVVPIKENVWRSSLGNKMSNDKKGDSGRRGQDLQAMILGLLIFYVFFYPDRSRVSLHLHKVNTFTVCSC